MMLSDTVAAAMFGVGGSVFVAVTAVITQLLITRSVIRAERRKLTEQLLGEEASRAREKRHDRILDAISDLLAASDPQSPTGVNYGQAANLIVRVQLLLDLKVPSHAALNGAVNELGLSLQEYVPVQRHPIDEKSLETRSLLRAHSKVLELTKNALRDILPSATLQRR
jgi:hypothetical protein